MESEELNVAEFTRTPERTEVQIGTVGSLFLNPRPVLMDTAFRSTTLPPDT